LRVKLQGTASEASGGGSTSGALEIGDNSIMVVSLAFLGGKTGPAVPGDKHRPVRTEHPE
jgi:hypothetical protein